MVVNNELIVCVNRCSLKLLYYVHNRKLRVCGMYLVEDSEERHYVHLAEDTSLTQAGYFVKTEDNSLEQLLNCNGSWFRVTQVVSLKEEKRKL